MDRWGRVSDSSAAVPVVASGDADVDEAMFRHGALTVGASALTLLSNLGTGVLLARVLGTAGRGATAAILTATQVFAWLFLIGSTQTISHYQARDPDRGPALLGTWLVLLLPLSACAVAVGELLLPVVMAAQSHHTIAVARLFMLTAGLVLLTELIAGYLLGRRHFVLFNALRVLTPLSVALAYVALWLLGDLSVASAVWSYAAVQALALALALAVCVHAHGIGRPDWGLARETLWYGIRAHSTNISTLLTARLDLLIMPAILTASSVGLYSVATNVSWIVFVLAGSTAMLVVPVATSAGERAPAIVIRSLHGTTILALVLAAVIAVIAGFAVRLVYGTAFAPSVLSLRLLLPGSVFYAMALVLVSGLYAAHRPFMAAATQGCGLIVTVVGLVLFLKRGGIEAAAIVSTVSYTLVFVIAAMTYRSVAGLAWSDFLSRRTSDADVLAAKGVDDAL
jgi:antigen flippase